MKNAKNTTAIVSDNTDFEVRSLDQQCVNSSEVSAPWYGNIKYMVAGILFGAFLVKSEVI